MTHALDISHFTRSVSGDLTAEKLDKLVARGVGRFIVSIADKDIARAQIAELVTADTSYCERCMPPEQITEETVVAPV